MSHRRLIPLPQIKCKHVGCDIMFNPKRTNNLYCCNGCKNHVEKENKKEWRSMPTKERIWNEHVQGVAYRGDEWFDKLTIEE